MKPEPQYYVDYLDAKQKFRPNRKYFHSFDAARQWCLTTMHKFDPDYIKPV